MKRENRKIVFLMPREGSWPSGGLKIILEYANRLARDGKSVKLVYPLFRVDEGFDFLHLIVYLFEYVWLKFRKLYKPGRWFCTHNTIEHHFVWRLENYQYNPVDIHVATAVHTAYSLDCFDVPMEQKYYFIQDFENWNYTDAQVYASYHFRMYKIAISTWLKQIIESCGEYADLVPNGFDFKCFNLTRSISGRNRYQIICLYHQRPAKDLGIAFKAFEKVKKEIPELNVTLFGVPDQPELPSYCSYYQKPGKELLRELYNQAAIYVGSSKVEGWGLTVGEAMICGCAVACTNNKGYLEMAKDGLSALVSKVGDADALAENIIKLIQDDKLRFRIAEQGNKFIQNFNIEDSFKKFESIICK